MAKTIKNYTSSIPASQSMARIEEMLVENGARDIMKSYNADGVCDSLVFIIAVPHVAQPMLFKLPAKVEKCVDALWKQYLKTVKKPSASMRITIQAQAVRTAWKIMHDWVELQMSLIQLEQVEVLEVFLPYAYNRDTKETFYEHAKSKGFKQLTQG